MKKSYLLNELFYKIYALLLGIWFLIIVNNNLFNGLWLDEFGTFWAVNGSFFDVFIKGASNQGQPPLFTLPVWIITKVFGISPVTLRATSVVAAAITLIFLYKFTKKLLGRQGAVLSCIAILLCNSFTTHTCNARSYSLAFMCFTLASYSLFNLLQRQKVTIKNAIPYILSSSGVIYSHYMWSITIPLFFLFATIVILKKHNKKKESLINLLYIHLVIGTLAIPAIVQILYIASKYETLAWTKIASFSDLRAILKRPTEFGLIALAFYLFTKFFPKTQRYFAYIYEPFTMSYIFIFAFLPTVIIVTLSSLFELRFFEERYFSYTNIAFALLIALVFTIPRSKLIKHLIIITAFYSYFPHISYFYRSSGWEGTFSSIKLEDPNGQCPIFFSSGFIESQHIEYILDNGLINDFIQAPAKYFQLKNELISLPYSFKYDDTRDYKNYIFEKIETTQCSFVVARNYNLSIRGDFPLPSDRYIYTNLKDRDNIKLSPVNHLAMLRHFRIDILESAKLHNQ